MFVNKQLFEKRQKDRLPLSISTSLEHSTSVQVQGEAHIQTTSEEAIEKELLYRSVASAGGQSESQHPYCLLNRSSLEQRKW